MGALSVIPVVIRRLGANARLMAAVVIGAVLAAGLMSTTSIYTDAIRDLGLAYAIRQAGADQINIRVLSSSQPADFQAYEQNLEAIEGTAQQALGPVLDGQPTAIGRSATFFPTAIGALPTEDELRPRSHLQFVTSLEQHVRVTAGRLPASTLASRPFDQGGTPPAVEAAIGGETAQRLGIRTGDSFDLHPFWAPEAPPVRLTISGIIDPVDTAEPYWLGITDIFSFESRWPTLPLFVTRDTFFNSIAAYLPRMTADFWSLFYLDTEGINARNAAPIGLQIESLERALSSNIPRTTTTTMLPTIIATFDEKLFFTRIPLLVLVIQISGIVLYYLFMVSTMLVERQAGEIALLKSRGATTAQVMQIYVIEGLLIFGVALGAGPPLAAAVISALGHTPPFADLTQGESLSVHLTTGAYAWAAGGALLAYLMLLWPAYRATRNSVVQQRTSSARPPREPFFTRYYLDLVLVGVAALLFYQLNRRGGLVTERLFGDQSVDPILLLTPAFFILTVGIAFLRLFPLVLKVAAWLVARVQGVAVLIGMWQLVRNPVHYSRLVLLLMLATAVGMFAASFGATVDRSYEDRAAYESGAPIRLTAVQRINTSGSETAAEAMQAALQAEAVSAAYRLSGSTGQIVDRTGINVLGLDPASFGDVAYFRDDFADRSLHSILEVLEQDEPGNGELALPADARYLGVWYNPTDLRGRVALEAAVRDARGRRYTYTFGPDNGYELPPGWVYLLADLAEPVRSFGGQLDGGQPVAPLSLSSIAVRFISAASRNSGGFLIDDLQASTSAPAPLVQSRLLPDAARSFVGLPGGRVIADFDTAAGWTPLQGQLPDRLNDEVKSTAEGASSALELVWRPVRAQPQTHGIRPAGDEAPLSAIVSGGFLRETGLQPGDVANVFIAGSFLDIRIDGSFDLFPTLADPRKEPAMLVNAARLSGLLNASPRGPAQYANDYWLRPGPESERLAAEAVGNGSIAAQLVSFEAIRAAQQNDPLVAAGWEGILFISFAAILLLSAIGFLIYSYLTAQRRTLEFAVLRTMGFSKRQVAAVVGFEQAFVIGLGMAAGTLLGLRLGSLMIRYMGVTETGDAVLPPMLLHVSWLTIGSAWLVLAIAFLATIGIVILLYSRLALHRVLRIGET